MEAWRRRSSPAAEESSWRRGPRIKRPCMSRATMPVIFESDGQSMGGGASKPRAGNELGEGGGSCLKSAENQRSLIENANATGCLLFHTTINISAFEMANCRIVKQVKAASET